MKHLLYILTGLVIISGFVFILMFFESVKEDVLLFLIPASVVALVLLMSYLIGAIVVEMAKSTKDNQ